MKPTLEQLEAIRSINSGRVGELFKGYLRDLLSYVNHTSVFSNDEIEKFHLDGRARQLYQLLELIESADDKIEALKNTQ